MLRQLLLYPQVSSCPLSEGTPSNTLHDVRQCWLPSAPPRLGTQQPALLGGVRGPAPSSPLHARATHGDLASPQAVAELRGDGDEASTQAPGGTRLGVDEGLHETTELVQGVDGTDQLWGTHTRTVGAGPHPACSLQPSLATAAYPPAPPWGPTPAQGPAGPPRYPTGWHSAFTLYFRPDLPVPPSSPGRGGLQQPPVLAKRAQSARAATTRGPSSQRPRGGTEQGSANPFRASLVSSQPTTDPQRAMATSLGAPSLTVLRPVSPNHCQLRGLPEPGTWERGPWTASSFHSQEELEASTTREAFWFVNVSHTLETSRQTARCMAAAGPASEKAEVNRARGRTGSGCQQGRVT